MGKKRRSHSCLGCTRPTKSVTRFCSDCRPAAAHPYVQRVDQNMISFGGLTFTIDQALHLSNAIVDTIEEAP